MFAYRSTVYSRPYVRWKVPRYCSKASLLGPDGGDRGGHAFLVPDVEPQDLGLAIDAGLAAGAEVVENRDLMTGGDVGVGHVRADETSTASDENLHRG